MLRLLLRTAPGVQFTRACVQVAYHGIAAPLFLGVTVVSVGLTLPRSGSSKFHFLRLCKLEERESPFVCFIAV
jgi:hypothetical protein